VFNGGFHETRDHPHTYPFSSWAEVPFGKKLWQSDHVRPTDLGSLLEGFEPEFSLSEWNFTTSSFVYLYLEGLNIP